MNLSGLPADVQSVRYSSGSVYVACSGIPVGYSIGPWPMNPNLPSDQGYLFRIPRAPQAQGGTRTATPLGPVAVWINGVAAFNALDAMSYNNRGVWHQNAVVVEALSFDPCLGHPAPGGAYHHHQNPRCLYHDDPTRHAPILGYAFDGFRIYGPYAYADPLAVPACSSRFLDRDLRQFDTTVAAGPGDGVIVHRRVCSRPRCTARSRARSWRAAAPRVA